MHITDPIADMLTRIRNANSAKHSTVDVPASNMKKAIAKILLDEGYIKNYQLIDDGTQGVNVCSRHTKPRQPGDEGGIIQKECPIYACKVMRVCPKCDKPTRPAHKLLADGKKVRVCKKCGAEI